MKQVTILPVPLDGSTGSFTMSRTATRLHHSCSMTGSVNNSSPGEMLLNGNVCDVLAELPLRLSDRQHFIRPGILSALCLWGFSRSDVYVFIYAVLPSEEYSGWGGEGNLGRVSRSYLQLASVSCLSFSVLPSDTVGQVVSRSRRLARIPMRRRDDHSLPSYRSSTST